MTEDSAVHQFFQLAAIAEATITQLEKRVEPDFDRVLEFVQAHADCRSALGKAFLQILREPEKGPPELVEYCMHALRWNEVRESVLSWLDAEQSERIRHVLRKQVLAFTDDWHDAGLYERFAREK